MWLNFIDQFTSYLKNSLSECISGDSPNFGFYLDPVKDM